MQVTEIETTALQGKRVPKARKCLRLTQIAVLAILAFSGVSASAAVVYQQTDGSGIVSVSAGATQYFPSGRNLAWSNRPATSTDPVYMVFSLRLATGTLSVSQTAVVFDFQGNSNCDFQYDLTSADKTMLADNSWHDFYVQSAPWSPSCPLGSSGSNGSWFISIGDGGVTFDIKANSGNTQWYGTVQTTAPIIPDGVVLTAPTPQTYTGNPIPVTGYYNNNYGTYNQIQFDVVFNGNQNVLFNNILLPLTNGSNLPFSTNRTLPFSGPYTIRARLFDTSNGSSTAWTATTSFALNSTSTNPLYVPNAPADTECDDSVISCALQKIVAWAFVPTSESVEQFKGLNSELAGRAPFAYVYGTPALFDELFNAPQTASTTISVTVYEGKPNEHTFVFLSASLLEAVPYSSTIRTILGWILWFMLIQAFYYQVIRVHDNTTPKH